MPNRILKERICTSSDIAQLSWLEEVFYYRLIVTVDDYGRFDARPAILKGRLFPLDDVTVKQIEAILSKLASLGMVNTYNVKGEPYLQILAWEKHQTIRNQKSKFPGPEKADKASSSNNTSSVSKNNACEQLNSIECKCSRNPIQSESNPNPNPESESKIYSPDKPDDVSEIPYALIIDDLNRVVGTRYQDNSQKTRKLIKARWKEGFHLDDFKTVIAKKAKEWMGTEMEKYLRPETLFGPKFEGYLNQSTGRRMSDAERIARL